MRKVVNLNESPSASQVFVQLLISIGIVLLFAFGCSIIGLYVASAVTGQGILSFSSSDPSSLSDTTVNGLKIIQVFSVLGLFILPALLLPKMLFKSNALQYTGLTARPSIILFVLALLTYFALVPMLDLSISLNQKMDLPDGWLEEWMRRSEHSAGEITKRFLVMPDMSVLLINIFIMALLPAFAEELFFRGFLQRTLYSWWRNKHVAIIVTAIFFSAIHMQFYGFLPRMLLGMLLGYLLVWSGDLKLPIFVHFLNNFTSLMMAYLNQDELNQFDINAPSAEYPGYLYIVSAVLGGLLLYQLYKFSRRRIQQEDVATIETGGIDWVKVFSTHRIYEAEIVAGNLESEGITAVVINKQDSSYGFGEVYVHVHAEDAERAQQLISSYKL